MSRTELATAGGALLALMAALVLLSVRLHREERLKLRLQHLRDGGGRSLRAARPRPGPGPVYAIGALGATIVRSNLLSAKTTDDFRQTLLNAGLRADGALGLFVGAKLLLTVAAPGLAWFTGRQLGASSTLQLALTAGAFALGLLLPDIVIRRLRASYVVKVERGLADALDMMVICAEAGLALEATIGRVAAELRHAHPSTADELTLTVSDLAVMADTRTALLSMGSRTGLPGLRRIGATMIQSIQYGTPLAHALRTLAAELRGEMLTRFEERAARLPVMLTIPMIVFILPTLFILVGGPALLQVLQLMRDAP